VYRKDLPGGTPPVRVHGEAATCLFLTLLQNAVRFSPEGGEIEVRARVDAESGRLVTVVRDQGPGVPQENREKIFEPFFTTAVDGLGMGLFVASRIADLQNIDLTLESGQLRGAAFRVGLPLA
jgi:signal transduction histidine kinase